MLRWPQRIISRMMKALILVVGIVLLTHCGGGGSYSLHWTLGCESGGPCEVKSPRECAGSAIDAIEVVARKPGSTGGERSVFPCFIDSHSADGEGAVGHGPELEATTYNLLVYALSPDGTRQLSRSQDVTVDVPDEGFVDVTVDLPILPACQDGMDNDHDGFVDLFDAGCKDAADSNEKDR